MDDIYPRSLNYKGRYTHHLDNRQSFNIRRNELASTPVKYHDNYNDNGFGNTLIAKMAWITAILTLTMIILILA